MFHRSSSLCVNGKGIFDPLIKVWHFIWDCCFPHRPLKRTAVSDQEGISSFIFPRIRDSNESGDHNDSQNQKNYQNPCDKNVISWCQVTAMMTNPDPASAVASAAIAAAAAGPLSKLVTILWLTSLAIVCHNSLMIIMIMITIMTVIKIIKVTINM